MEETKLKELLKEAFNKGRDYQYDINPYSGKLKEDSKALSFTKWYNQVKNIKVIPCCETLPTDEEIYSEGCKYVREIEQPNRQPLITLRRTFKAGATFVKKQLDN